MWYTCYTCFQVNIYMLLHMLQISEQYPYVHKFFVQFMYQYMISISVDLAYENISYYYAPCWTEYAASYEAKCLRSNSTNLYSSKLFNTMLLS